MKVALASIVYSVDPISTTNNQACVFPSRVYHSREIIIQTSLKPNTQRYECHG
jgi:hypothetical protein